MPQDTNPDNRKRAAYANLWRILESAHLQSRRDLTTAVATRLDPPCTPRVAM